MLRITSRHVSSVSGMHDKNHLVVYVGILSTGWRLESQHKESFLSFFLSFFLCIL
jgi:hypothetical protein